MNVKKMKKEGESLKPKFKGGSTQKKRTEEFLKLIKEKFEANPYLHMNKAAKELDVAPSTITISKCVESAGYLNFISRANEGGREGGSRRRNGRSAPPFQFRFTLCPPTYATAKEGKGNGRADE